MLTAHSLCWLCQMPLAMAHWGMCSRCTASLLVTPSLCPQCGLPALAPALPCGRCLQKPPPWQRLVTVNSYAPPLSGLVHQFKFARHPELAAALARLLLYACALIAGCRQWIGLSACRCGSAVIGVGDLTKARRYVVRWRAGWAAPGAAMR